MVQQELEIKRAFAWAAQAFINNFFVILRIWLISIVGFVLILLAGVPLWLGASIPFMQVCATIATIGALWLLISGWITTILSYAFALAVYDNRYHSLRELVPSATIFFRYLAVRFVMSLCTSIGLIFLVIPGIWLHLRWFFAEIIVIDRHSGVFDSLSESVKITRKKKLKLLWVDLLFLLVMALTRGYAILIAGPFFALVHAHLYRQSLGVTKVNDVA